VCDGLVPGNLERIVFLDGAEFSADAARNFAGCGFDVFNIASRSDVAVPPVPMTAADRHRILGQNTNLAAGGGGSG
jgi:hypothetical protein